MQYILSRASRGLLADVARKQTLFAFDFDGTLAPIVDEPSRAAMRALTRSLLARLAAVRPCVIISGRGRTDLLGRVKGVPAAHVIGNHGAETESGSREAKCRVNRWKDFLLGELAGLAGVWIEDKGLSLAVHYRQSPAKAEARRRILESARGLPGANIFGGKQVVNVVCELSPDKGEAVAAERDRMACRGILYVGDDENDEAAFVLGGEIVPVRVGRKQRTRARYYLRSQKEIDQLLEILVADCAVK